MAMHEFEKASNDKTALHKADHCQKLLVEFSKEFSPLYIVIDALDECREPRKLTLDLIRLNKEAPNIRILVSGRDHADIRDELLPSCRKIWLERTLMVGDVQKFIRAEIQRKAKSSNHVLEDASLQIEIENRIIERSEGM
jgi:hypothetical protein